MIITFATYADIFCKYLYFIFLDEILALKLLALHNDKSKALVSYRPKIPTELRICQIKPNATYYSNAYAAFFNR